MAIVNDRVVGQVYNEIRKFHILSLLIRTCRFLGLGGRLVAPENSLHPGHQLLGVKGLDHIVVGAQLQSQNLVKNLSLGGEHDNGYLGGGAQLPAHLVAVHAGKHQVKENEVWLKDREHLQGLLAVAYNLRLIALLGQIQGDKLRNIFVVIHNEDFLFFCHDIPFCPI